MQHKCKLAAMVQAAGYLLFGYGVFGDGRISSSDLVVAGAATVVGSLIWYLSSRNRAFETAMLEQVRQQGYDDGYKDGRRVARPVTVRLNQDVG